MKVLRTRQHSRRAGRSHHRPSQTGSGLKQGLVVSVSENVPKLAKASSWWRCKYAVLVDMPEAAPEFKSMAAHMTHSSSELTVTSRRRLLLVPRRALRTHQPCHSSTSVNQVVRPGVQVSPAIADLKLNQFDRVWTPKRNGPRLEARLISLKSLWMRLPRTLLKPFVMRIHQLKLPLLQRLFYDLLEYSFPLREATTKHSRTCLRRNRRS